MYLDLFECQSSQYQDAINYLGDFNSNLTLKILSFDWQVMALI